MPVANVPNARGWRLGCSCRVSANSNVEVTRARVRYLPAARAKLSSLPLMNRAPWIGLTASVHRSSFELSRSEKLIHPHATSRSHRDGGS